MLLVFFSRYWRFFTLGAVILAAIVIGPVAAGPRFSQADAPATVPAPTKPPVIVDAVDAETDGAPVASHLDTARVNSGALPSIFVQHQGDTLFRFMFTRLDGAASRPINGKERSGLPRMSGPESQSCSACHSQLTTVDGLLIHVPGGSGDNALNTFSQAGVPDDPARANIRHTRAIYGGGLKERLAEEMSADLARQVDAARTQAKGSRAAVTVDLLTKGVGFGRVTVKPDGTLDTREVQGVDADLIVKPFSAKGTVATLREFTQDAAERHLGLRTVEGAAKDGELTSADLTALVLWQATRPTPRQVAPKDAARAEDARRGQAVFNQIGCASCHVAALPLNDPLMTVTPPDAARPLRTNLMTTGLQPASAGAPLPIAIYSDLKRHDMGEALAEPLPQGNAAPEMFLTRPLWGVSSVGPWLHDGRATTLSEAILWHGGEAETARAAFAGLPRTDQRALMEFLRTLVIDPYPTDSPQQ
ncbi:MAG: di-heme oxidoredictase family protein [Anaerolineae bacterium]